MLAVPVCIYVLSFSTRRHLYTFMYTPSLSPHPIFQSPKSYAHNVNNDNNDACARAHARTHARTHAHTHTHTHTFSHSIFLT